MSQTYVSLDLETTGLKPESDEIIEVAAVRFQGRQLIDTFHTLVNPRRPLPYRIRALTGIAQSDVDTAPLLSEVSAELISFLGNHPIVGHNIAFDLSFLSWGGISLLNQACDTLELASILLPRLSGYSLSFVTEQLGISHFPRHRALPDAMAAKDVFLALLEKASQLDPAVISEVNRLTSGTEWPLRHLFQGIEEAAFSQGIGLLRGAGLDLPVSEAKQAEPLSPKFEKKPLDVEILTAILEPDGPLAQALPSYEHRPEQIRMMQAVAQAQSDSQHLIVEAGPGTGKSIAYLLPSIFLALENNAHVVISTNTINLQEQLINKDIPDLLHSLEKSRNLPHVDLRAVQVKGRGNYLCLRRWASLKSSQGLPLEEVKTLIRILVWLSSTETGDRAELNLGGSGVAVWNKVCAQADNCLAGQCPYQGQGACFLHRARGGAESAHLIVVNHALLLSDMVSTTNILPKYSYLIIDEAHHLEEEATEQLGFRLAKHDLSDYLNRLSQEVGRERYGLLSEIKNCFRDSSVAVSTRGHIEQLAGRIQSRVEAARTNASRFFGMLGDFLQSYSQEQGEYERRLRLTMGIRVQPAWSEVEVAWENLNLVLMDIEDGLGRLYSSLGDLSDARILNYQNLMLELSFLIHSNLELRHKINSVTSNPEADSIYWCSLNGQSGLVTLAAAPLHVGQLLEESLFSTKDSVILTSATLSTEGTFEYIKERLGLNQVAELLLGTPFDYLGSTMVYIPNDIPEPGTWGYQLAVEAAIYELCRATSGRALVLFTSHSALRATHSAIQAPLAEEQILTLGQGVDGAPKQLLTTFKANPRSVLMGTAGLWEGIDVMGEALSILVITRLPFTVPTEPVFAARSEMFDDSFNQYALPQAILRFKQGFGRLIRSKTDRGVVVVLDRRLKTKPYGTAFLESLPPCTVTSGSSGNLPATVAGWLGD